MTVPASGLAVAMPKMLLAQSPKSKRSPKTKPKNWVWINSVDRTTDEWREALAPLKNAGIDAILPEVFDSRVAHFEHPHPAFASSRRSLERIIPIAHELEIEVHAWMWTVPCNNRRIVKEHADWYAVNAKRESASNKPAYVGYYKFLCPRKPQVRQFIGTTAEALAKVEGLDGVHLDYVRLPDVILAKGLWEKYGIVQDREYPQYDYCYCDDCRALFQQQSGADPLTDLDDPSTNEAWRQFRCNSVTELVNEHLVPVIKRHGKQVTAAVFPNWWNVRQEWHRWNLDGFLPMLYHSFYDEDVAWIGKQIRAARKRMPQPVPIYAGLFSPALDHGEFDRALKTAAAAGADGVSLFELGGLRESHFQALMRLDKLENRQVE